MPPCLASRAVTQSAAVALSLAEIKRGGVVSPGALTYPVDNLRQGIRASVAFVCQQNQAPSTKRRLSIAQQWCYWHEATSNRRKGSVPSEKGKMIRQFAASCLRGFAVGSLSGCLAAFTASPHHSLMYSDLPARKEKKAAEAYSMRDYGFA